MSNQMQDVVNQSQPVGSVCGHENSFMRPLVKLNSIMNVWIKRQQQRKQLAQLEQHLLKDVGLTDEQVQREVSKPFWK